jgi:hypothetical protein
VDIMREQYDGAVGLQSENSNLPSAVEWSTYVARLTEIANRFS